VQLARTQGKQLGGGVNLYLNGHAFKVQGDYFYIFGSSGAEPRHLARLQLDASF
jgi:phosphate-selective porin OprO and OprP